MDHLGTEVVWSITEEEETYTTFFLLASHAGRIPRLCSLFLPLLHSKMNPTLQISHITTETAPKKK